MDFLFSKKQYALYKLLTTLYSDNRFWTLDELALKTALSRPTVQTYLQIIPQLLKPLGKDVCLIKSFKGSYLYKIPSISFNRIRLLILKESIPFNFINSVTFKKHSSLSTFCAENYISKSHFYKVIKESKAFLEQYNIAFNFTNMQFVGQEKDIRYFLFAFLWECYGGIEWPFHVDKNDLYFAKQRNEVNKEFSIPFHYVEQWRHSFLASITKLRFEQGHTIDAKEISTVTMMPALTKIIKNILFQTTASPGIIENETKYLYKMIQINIWKSLDYINRKLIIQEYRTESPANHNFSNRILDVLKNNFGLDLSQNEEAIYSLLVIGSHVEYMGSIAHEMYMQQKISYYKERFPSYSQLLDTTLRQLSLDEKLTSFIQSKDFLFLQLTYIIETHKNLSTFDPQLIVWVTNSSYSNKVKRIEAIVEKYSPFHLKICTGHAPPENCDLILSDIELPEFKGRNIYIYSDPPSLEKLNALRNY
ncbi:helix-turn-helix domain-containing protein [Listeria aquatica]|uniref:helix-turn-helix domain-containing protein n=1 Tax=Listeria aquatica TaxID=1494960 RepID=UPI003F6EBCCA